MPSLSTNEPLSKELDSDDFDRGIVGHHPLS